jgi:hypothetical protein
MPLFGGGGDKREEARAKMAAFYARRLQWTAEWRAGRSTFVDRVSIDTLGQDSQREAYQRLEEYVAAVGLRPEDTYVVNIEHPINTDYTRISTLGIVYRDRAEYAAGRERYWAEHPERAAEPLDPSITMVP